MTPHSPLLPVACTGGGAIAGAVIALVVQSTVFYPEVVPLVGGAGAALGAWIGLLVYLRKVI